MKPALTCYRYGSPRAPQEGLRIGVARQVPRGVKRADWRCRGYFDLWLPLVSPTPELVAAYRHGKIDFKAFSRRYKTQMKAPTCRQVIELLATLSLVSPISIGCYCEEESRCHRSLLHELVMKDAKTVAPLLTSKASSKKSGKHHETEDREYFASPVCYASEE